MKNKLCKQTQTIRELLEVLNCSPCGFAFIVDADEKLKGIVTDGDVRRYLLQGFGLNQFVQDLKIPMCIYALITDDNSDMLQKMNSTIRVLPIVNEEFKPVDYLQYDERKHIPVAIPNLEGNELKYVTDAMLSTWISSSGHYIDKFEEGFSQYIGAQFGVATSNGTVALHLALLALGIGEGDEVIIPDLTFAATINAVLHANATPIIVDVEQDSWCIDPLEIKRAITKKTKAIIPVHLYGQPCDMKQIMEIAKKNNLSVIEDCAEAHGAEFEGRKVGVFGDISCFSFFGNKIITTGEGGMCITNSAELNKKLRQYRDHGMSPERRYWHDVVGYNYRMTNVQAAIGCAQLERIDVILSERAEIEEKYRDILKSFNFIQLQNLFENRKKVTWLVSVLVDELLIEPMIALFNDNKIDVRHFFYPLSDMPIYAEYLFSNKNAQSLSKNGLCFPTHKMVDFAVIKSVLESYSERKKN